MTHYIDTDALVAEIERRVEHNTEWKDACKTLAVLAANQAIEEDKKILSIIKTLEVKEVDLEEKATQLSQKYFPDEENIWARPNIEAQRCKSACIEMVEWFKAQKGEKV